MASKSLCSIPDCGKPVASRGWCNAHHLKYLAYGDPTVQKRTPNGKHMEWLQKHAGHQSDDCLKWPFGYATGGRGAVNHPLAKTADRLMCIVAHGEPVGERNEVAHSCSKGHEGCVNPRHLRWATHFENMQDKYADPMTAAKAAEIRRLAGSVSQRRIARSFGISQAQVSRIIAGLVWS